VPTIQLPSGHQALVDDADLPTVTRHKWHVMHKGRRLYVRTYLGTVHGRRRSLFMHQLLLPCPRGLEPDHVDGNGLNNTRSNLRKATRSQNNANQRKRARPATSPYKGVSRKRNNHIHPWQARIDQQGHQIHLGYYPTPEAAAHAYDRAARELYGDYARTNFPQEANP
jgi:hypothetical protein